MSDSSTLNVVVREDTGRSKVRRLRAAGKVPAVIYGLGKDPVNLAVPTDQMDKAIRAGNRIVTLAGVEAGDAFIKEVQWDTWGAHVLHVDFTRVEAGKLLEVTVSLDARGDAPGSHIGGAVEQPIHEIQLLVPPRSMTDRIEININSLGLNETITIGQLNLPEGAEAVDDADTVIIQCLEQVEQADPDDDATPDLGGAEPEVIGKKDDEAGGDS